ncbi:MAG: hypothetical protein QF590_00170 [Dehalococcoidia bacterium]|nr:hypothetical protein [Dehalococcoidia bacterium]MDP7485306.1 hypothetical protein [Dehalococcoidia bacterium]
MDYQGYGRPEGEPPEEGMYLDATATYELNRKLHPGKKIVVFGRSMCGAVAAHLAKDVSRTALVLEAAISSLRYAMHEQVPLTRFLPRYLIMRSKLETTKHVSTRLVPTLILHGNSYQTVSVENTHRIFEAAPKPKQMHILRVATTTI